MKKTMLILFTLLMVLSIALTITATCFAEEVDNVVYDNETLVDNSVDNTISEQTSDNNANLWFSKIWEKCKEWVIAIGSGISIAGIGTAIGYALVKTLTTRTANKIADGCNSQTIADKTSKALMEHLGNVALDVNIAPVLQSQYKAISEEINAELNINLNKQDKKNLALIKCFKAFADYFSCSVAISDEQKQALANAINDAELLYANTDSSVTAKIEVVAEAPVDKDVFTGKKIVENY